MADKDAESTNPAEEALEHKVDAMMDPKNPDPKPADTSRDKPTGPPPLDIFAGSSSPADPEPAKAEESAPAAAEIPDKTKLDDPATETAVDQIAASESDELLAVQDAKSKTAGERKPQKPVKHHLSRLLHSRKFWLVLGLLVIVLAVVPWTRYHIAGLAVRRELHVKVLDSKTNTPVSDAVVSFNGHQGITNASGVANFRAPVGQGSLVITKQYYKDSSSSLTVGFHGSTSPQVLIHATGRQVPVTVVNSVSGLPLAGVTIKILNTTARTNAKGRATIVLPASGSTAPATLSADGYNTIKLNVTITSQVVPANKLHITPSGRIYFLSNLSGKIDVVSTNLDGSGRKTILAGTGSEDPNNTSLLASRDWHYMVLESQRNGGKVGLYLINAATGKITDFDSSDANFTLIGWYGHNFMYDIVSNSVPLYQNGHEVIKSYDADNQQLNQLDASQAQGTANSYGYQTFSNFYILNNELVYNTQWYTFDNTGSGFDLGNATDSIRGVQPGGQGKKDFQTWSPTSIGYVQAVLYEPQAIYYAAYNYSSNQATYYEFEGNTVRTITNVTQATFDTTYPTYLISPSGKSTFWTDLRDGKNALFTGESNADKPKQLATSGEYKPYGWYSDNYLLVSKNSSELYVMPVGGLKAGQVPLKVTDYYKPAQSFFGYGYGYGGL
ncbi:MAG TPA: hypothetical protein VHB51_01070 [Candidatus Saccharimonadales bacterium]|nr:hypothetical protein [Candidatus Saccharimonadales bacterium]